MKRIALFVLTNVAVVLTISVVLQLLGIERILDELESPVSIDEVVAAATPKQRAIELYTASRVAIEPDSAAERGYLALLAARLGLEDELVANIEREIAADPAPAAEGKPA